MKYHLAEDTEFIVHVKVNERLKSILKAGYKILCSLHPGMQTKMREINMLISYENNEILCSDKSFWSK